MLETNFDIGYEEAETSDRSQLGGEWCLLHYTSLGFTLGSVTQSLWLYKS